MLMLKTRPAAKGRRNMKARLEPFSRSFWKQKGPGERPRCDFVPVLPGHLEKQNPTASPTRSENGRTPAE